MRWTHKAPNKPGYYWYYDSCCKQTLIVKIEQHNGLFYVTESEYAFEIRTADKKDKWCYVPKPKILL